MVKPPKKRNKKYNPNKSVYTCPPLIKLTENQSRYIKLYSRQNLENFVAKRATRMDWVNLTTRLKVGKALLLHFNEQLYQLPLDSSLTLLEAVKTDYEAFGVWQLRDVEVRQIADALTIVDEIQDYCTRIELMDAHQLIQKENDAKRLYTQT